MKFMLVALSRSQQKKVYSTVYKTDSFCCQKTNFTRKPFNPTNRKPFLRSNRIDYDSPFGVNDDDDVENQNKQQIDPIPNAMLDNTYTHPLRFFWFQF